MLAFIAFSGLLYFGFSQKMKRNRIEREAQEEIYRQELAFKKKELTSQTLHLVQKNMFLEPLRKEFVKGTQSFVNMFMFTADADPVLKEKIALDMASAPSRHPLLDDAANGFLAAPSRRCRPFIPRI